MTLMITLSLLLNVAVLAPVCNGLIQHAPWVEASLGGATAARGILLSVYLAILVVSLGLLAFPEPLAVAALLVVQIVYKVTTPATVGTLRHPVVLSNLGIAAFHAVTLATIVLP
eukprot:CAMPEP_0198338516 /NCGR_PEP_ID=MMETSP1450-20131203/34787_1 /TAXON_ID=753684 ORGANISM="Madagascaria erythrocladiodes, Strain CCMP3234" /NCGR_SAMPLE_ID=MMETSP1450 /ASSEMBLY_ACC=CAM_ASM_001115 /LENGTH=113 /DNA_ID=CAMNT_0044043393 /DNA_START=106 /DNA_END=447 /DNA_ORIENTATION=+